MRNFRKNKYGNASCKCWAEHIHDSRGEASYCNKLSLLKKAKEIKSYETQIKFSLSINECRICNHYVDFLVQLPDGTSEVHEYKGFPTDVWKLKKKLFEAINPEIPYKVFSRKNLL